MGGAAAVSFALGVVVFLTLGGLQEPYEQIFEGAAMLLAAGVVTWMLFWMRRQAGSVKGDLQRAVDEKHAILKTLIEQSLDATTLSATLQAVPGGRHSHGQAVLIVISYRLLARL